MRPGRSTVAVLAKTHTLLPLRLFSWGGPRLASFQVPRRSGRHDFRCSDHLLASGFVHGLRAALPAQLATTWLFLPKCRVSCLSFSLYLYQSIFLALSWTSPHQNAPTVPTPSRFFKTVKPLFSPRPQHPFMIFILIFHFPCPCFFLRISEKQMGCTVSRPRCPSRPVFVHYWLDFFLRIFLSFSNFFSFFRIIIQLINQWWSSASKSFFGCSNSLLCVTLNEK